MIPFDRWTYAARVVHVHDGDTIRAEVDLGFEVRATMTLRLLGVQCPEVAGPGVTLQEKRAGAAARDWLDARLLEVPPGKLFVRTEKDHAEGRGRYLATLLVDVDGGALLNLNAQLVAVGHAIETTGSGKVPKWIGPGLWRRADGIEVSRPIPT